MDRLKGAWLSMRQRCRAKPGSKDWAWYGAKGIKVCARWSSYAMFAADMGPHPGKGWSLHRKRGSQGYRRGNCVWATMKTQQRERCNNKLTLAQATAIRSEPGSSRAVGLKYGVDQKMVLGIRKGRYWSN